MQELALQQCVLAQSATEMLALQKQIFDHVCHIVASGGDQELSGLIQEKRAEEGEGAQQEMQVICTNENREGLVRVGSDGHGAGADLSQDAILSPYSFLQIEDLILNNINVSRTGGLCPLLLFHRHIHLHVYRDTQTNTQACAHMHTSRKRSRTSSRSDSRDAC